MLHPSIIKKSTGNTINGIYGSQFAPSNGQTAPTPFQVDQNEVLTLTHQESFALIVAFTGVGAYGMKGKLNAVDLSDAHVIAKSTVNVATGAGGALTYTGAGDSTLTLGLDNKPIAIPFTAIFSDLVATATKTNNFTLSLGPGRELYNFVVQTDNTIKLYVRNGGAWALVNTYALGHTLVNADTVGYRITAEKIELLINDVSVFNVNRTWSVVVPTNLGVLSAAGPYTFGAAVDLTIGTTPGTYALAFHNQLGTALQIEQSIVVTDQKAVVTTATTDMLLPVVAASVIANAGTGLEPAPAPATTDWGKLLTWGGIMLAGIVVVAGLLWVVMGKRN